MKSTKNLWFFSPTQLLTQGQWWSIFRMHLLQILQEAENVPMHDTLSLYTSAAAVNPFSVISRAVHWSQQDKLTCSDVPSQAWCCSILGTCRWPPRASAVSSPCTPWLHCPWELHPKQGASKQRQIVSVKIGQVKQYNQWLSMPVEKDLRNLHIAWLKKCWYFENLKF